MYLIEEGKDCSQKSEALVKDFKVATSTEGVSKYLRLKTDQFCLTFPLLHQNISDQFLGNYLDFTFKFNACTTLLF